MLKRYQAVNLLVLPPQKQQQIKHLLVFITLEVPSHIQGRQVLLQQQSTNVMEGNTQIVQPFPRI